MWTASILLTALAFSPGGDTPGADIEGRCRDLREAAVRDVQAGKMPWQTFREYGPRLLRLAEEDPAHPASLPAVLAAGEYGSRCLDTCTYDAATNSPLMERVFGALAAGRLDDERVGRFCLTLARLPSHARESFLREVARASKDRSVEGRACLALAELLKVKLACAESLPEMMRADGGARAQATWGQEYLDHLLACDQGALSGEVEALLERVVRDFREVAFVRGTGETPVWRATAEKDVAAGKTLGAVAGADLDELRSLAPGCLAPEIEGRDADGVAFKLSDQRGKVVLLSFSGNWCGPCRSMYPFERDLVSRLEGKPFALLGINTDEDVATLRRSLDSRAITWRCWWDGAPGGPISSRWNVRAWPTIYLIDARGVIRAKDPSDEALGGLIDGLIAEAKARPGGTR